MAHVQCRLLSGMLLVCWLVCGATQVLAQAPAVAPAQIRLLEGHSKPIYAVAYSPDGKFIYTASFDRTVKVWDRVTGTVIRTFADHQNGVLSLAVAKNGQQFATAGLDRKIHLYDVPLRDPLANGGLGGDAVGVAVSADGTLLVTADKAPLLRLWNGVTGAHIRDFPGLTAPATSLFLTDDKKFVIVGTADGFVRAYDVEKGALIGTLAVPGVSALDVSTDGKSVATVGPDGALRISSWPNAGPLALAGHSQAITGVKISKDGLKAITASIDQTVRQFELKTGKEVKAYAGQPGPVASLAVSDKFDLLATGNSTGQLKFWKLDGTDLKSLAGHTGPIPALVFQPDGERIASGGADGTIRIWQLPPDVPKSLPGHSQPPQALAVSLNGKLTVSAGADKLALIFDNATGKLAKQLPAALQPLTTIALNDDDTLLAAGDALGGIRVSTLETGKPQGDVAAHPGGVTGLAFQPKSKSLVSSGADGTVKFWQLPLSEARALTTHGNALTALVMSKTKPFAFSAAVDQTVKQTSLETGKEVLAFAGLTSAPTILALSPDEKFLVAGQANGSVRFWNTADGVATPELAAQTGALLALAYHPKGTQLATSGQDALIRIWESPIRPVTPLAGHTKPVQSVSMSLDGTLLATAGADQTVRIWQADGKLVATLEGHAQPVLATAITSDKLHVLSGDAGGKIRVGKPAAGAAISELGAHTGAVTGIAVHPTQPLAASSGADGMVRIWQLPVVPAKLLPVHAQEVRRVAVSKDGKLVVSGSADGVVRMVNPETGMAVRELKGQSGPVQSVALSPDNTQIATSAADGSVRFWKAADGAELGSVSGSEVPALDVAVHPAGLLAASASQDGLIRIWQLPLVAPKTIAAHKQPVTAAALSPNGQILATAAADNSVVLWNLATGQQLRPLAGHIGPVTSLAWRADNAALVTGSADKSARLWNVADGKQLAIFDQHGAEVRAVAITPAGDQVFTGGADNVIKQWIVADGKPAKEFKGHTAALSALKMSADGALLISGAADSTARIWNVAAATETRAVNHGAAVQAISLSADGTKLASSGADNLIKIWNVADGAAAGVLTGHAGPVGGVAWLSDNLRLASVSADGTVRVWNVTGTLLETYRAGKGALHALAVSADSKLLIAAGTDGQVHIVTPAAVRVLAGHMGAVNAIAFNPAGDRLISAGADKTVRGWNVADGAPATQYAGSTDVVTALTVSADGAKVVAAGADKQVRIWNLADGAAGPVLPQPNIVRSVSLSPDASKLAVTGDDAVVRVWDVATAKELETFSGHVGAVTSVAFAGDNKTLYSSGADKSLRQWTVSAIRVIPAHEGKANAVAFNGDGTVLVSGGDDKFIKLWQLTGMPVRQIAGIPAAVTGLAVRRDSAQIAGTVADNSVMLWNFDGTPFAAVPRIAQPAVITAIAYSDDNQKLAIAVGDSHLRVVSAVDGKLLQDLPQASVVSATRFTPDSKSLLVGGADNSAKLIPYSLLRLIAGHEGPVTSLAYSPNTEHLLSGGADKTVRLWNLADGAAVRAFAGHADIVTNVAFTPDGAQVLAAGQDKTVRVWKTADAAVVATLTHAAPVRSISVSSNGLSVATSGDDAVARVWDLVSGKELQYLPGHTAAIPAVGIAADGKTIITASSDKSVRLNPLSATKVIAAHPVKTAGITLTPDGVQVLSSGDDKILKLWDATGKPVRQFAGSQTPLRRLAIRGDLQQVAAGGDEQLTDKGLYFWKFADGALIQRIETPAAIQGLAYSPDGSQVAVSQTDNHIRIYASEGGLLLEDIITPQAPLNLAYLSPQLLAVGQADNQTRLFGVSFRQILAGHVGAVNALAYSADGKWILSAGADKTLRLWDVASGKVVRNYAGCADVVTSAGFSADGKFVIAGSTDKNLRIWPIGDPIDPKVAATTIAATTTILHPAIIQSVAFAPDGLRFATAGDDNLIRVWDRATGLELERFVGHTASVTKLAFSDDGEKLISGGNDPAPRIWSASTHQVRQIHKGPATAVKLTRDGKAVFTIGEDGAVVQSGMPDLKELRRLTGAAGPARALAISTDNLHVAAGGDDKHLRIWNAADGVAVADVATPAAVTSLAWSRTGTKLVAGGGDNIIRTFGLFAPDAKTPDAKLTVLQIQEGLGHTAAVTGVALSGDERSLFSVSVDRTWKRWLSAGVGPTLRLEGHGAQVYALDFSADGKLLASASGDKTVRIWNTADGKQVAKCEGHKGQVYAVTFSPNGLTLASAGADKAIRLWKLDGTAVKEWTEGIEDGLYSLQYYADANYLMSAGLARTWQFWNLNDLKTHRTATGHTDHVYRAVFSPSWSRVASVDYSGHLFIWDTGTGNPLHHQQLPASAAYSVSYSPDGKELAIGTQDSRLVILAIPPQGQ
jgi:WD40 repeat protein